MLALAPAINDRRASFTAASLGKAAATSGARTTMLESAFMRAAYRPRVRPAGKSSAWYPALSSSRPARLTFFVESPLRPSRYTSADDPHDVASLRVRHDEQSTALRGAERDVPVLPQGVVGIRAGCRERVPERSRSILERDPVTAEIRSRLPLSHSTFMRGSFAQPEFRLTSR